ncbi:hypothetical protein [Brevibacillus sp. NRS-1366]|uniref:hypothetical protein n=1 Tax=Brevibacillus sp. NRS-1366 TaxID=3233899 RepID=UPI003D1D066B
MLDFGAVSIEWKTIVFQLFVFLLFPVLLVAGCLGIVRSRYNEKQTRIRDLEKRIEALERERNDPKS